MTSHTKLTTSAARDIIKTITDREHMKERLKDMSNAQLAKKYGVHIRTIDRISSGQTWKHVL